MKNEMEMFESSSEVLKIGIEEYLEKQLNQIGLILLPINN